MTTPRIGLTFTPFRPPEDLRTFATAAEEAGLDELWVWEDCFRESGIASAAAALAWTERITVGIGLLPVALRNVALTGMELATLDRLFQGRVIPGIGHGVQSWMGQTGARPESPVTLLREYGTALRRLLDGERVTVTGRYVNLDDVALDWPPERTTLWAGAQGPKSLALSTELGDGVLLGGMDSYETTARSIEIIRGVRDSRGEPLGPITTTIAVATGPDADALLAAEIAAWDKQPEPGIGVAGDPAAIADVVRRFGELGITTVSVLPCRTDPDIPALIRTLGEVKAHL